MKPATVTRAIVSPTTGEITAKQQTTQYAAEPPSIEVVNEIQIVAHKRENQRSVVTSPSDNKEIKKCISSRSSKTDLTAVTTPTTVTLDAATKNVTITKNSRRSSKNPSEKDKSESNSTICMCGKLLKRVKELLEAKETKTKRKRFFSYFLFLSLKFLCLPPIISNAINLVISI